MSRDGISGHASPIESWAFSCSAPLCATRFYFSPDGFTSVFLVEAACDCAEYIQQLGFREFLDAPESS
jgi:hypothetical protein